MKIRCTAALTLNLLAALHGSEPAQADALPGEATPETLAREIQALQPANLVWRQIPWNYCLLEGLQKSRDERKPILLWAFINADPASERC